MGFIPKEDHNHEHTPEIPYYDANVGEAVDRWGNSLSIGDVVGIEWGNYINRTGTVLDVAEVYKGQWACAVHIPGFGTRCLPTTQLQRRK